MNHTYGFNEPHLRYDYVRPMVVGDTKFQSEVMGSLQFRHLT